jgi:hypothetical protein
MQSFCYDTAWCGIIRPASPKSSSRPLRRNTPEANWSSPARLVMKLRCYLSSLLRIHRPDCEHCKAREKCGLEMRERLEELNWRTQPNWLLEGVHGELVEVYDSKPREVVGSPTISLAQRVKKAG